MGVRRSRGVLAAPARPPPGDTPSQNRRVFQTTRSSKRVLGLGVREGVGLGACVAEMRGSTW